MRTVVVFDTETTGLRPYDRIVSLAAIKTVQGSAHHEILYRCFDPRKDSDPTALAIHGWDDWTTRFQDLFADHARDLRAWFDGVDLVVAHNVGFDLHYLNREFRKAGEPPIQAPSYCTMDRSRALWSGQATLDSCAGRIGLERRGEIHRATEDAFFAWNVFRHHHGQPLVPSPAEWSPPSNFRLPPARPLGDLPRRTAKRPGQALQPWTPEQRSAVLERVRPVAIVLLSVALSDRMIAPDERAILALAVAKAVAHLNLPSSPTQESDLLAELMTVEPTGNRITRAVTAVLSDVQWREELPRMIAAMAAGTGIVDGAKRAALAGLKSIVTKLAKEKLR